MVTQDICSDLNLVNDDGCIGYKAALVKP